MDPRLETEKPRNGLPVISQETRDKILEEMGLTQTDQQQTPGGGSSHRPTYKRCN